MKRYLIIGVVLIVAVVVAVVVIRHHDSPSGQVPDLDAAAVQTGDNLHPPKLNP
jgi:hypothetical protein